ncbi:NAD(P)/FAD-dependent oxidoreductase [Actinopolymorpha singaporensis]|uniref:NADH dehydrogenase n=1 Tax=Actinopolymorpha singaporensis TaxID=117157 RepID=A0A1H1QCP4_9ACTN|nr:NAD(P)/FAD-dependent oxidoreductase [Actinopolymorpha singaporensis]SDS21216.1 NADH dehydrogenase [Actinopolymorpha singaporensis]
MTEPNRRPRIVVVGAGFAGFHATRELERLSRGRAEIVLINPTDYFLYLPLLPEVASGVLDPRQVSVPLSRTLRDACLTLGTVDGVDLDSRTVSYVDPEERRHEVTYDRLVLAPGSVNKLLPIPGVCEYAHGFRSVGEALYLRDHLIGQIELAGACDDSVEREARCTFVVVGAGYTGTEVAAQGQLLTKQVARAKNGVDESQVRWLLVDVADRLLPGLDPRLAATTDRTLRRRGVEVRTGTSVEKATADGVLLSDGEFVPTKTLVWCVGVRPDPLIESLGEPTEKGRLVVDEYLSVPGRPEVFACGDAAAVPDLTRPGQVTAMTAQHAERQGKAVARNVAASFGDGRPKPYKHHDLGFVVDLGGLSAAANPLGVALAGAPAAAVTKGYHLLSVPANRIRIAADWALDAMLRRQVVKLGLVGPNAVPLESEQQ